MRSQTGSAATDQRHQALLVLRILLIASMVSTALHFAHNYVEVHHYAQSDLATYTTTRWGILIVWPVLTAIGLLGYWLYARGICGSAHVCLAMYSIAGLVSLGHFIDGSPDIAPFWYATIFVDAALGMAILGFVIWSWMTSASTRARPALS
jgi:hypothetical protein